MSKVVSEDSIRRALGKGGAEEWDTWLGKQERMVYKSLLTEDYVLDIDNTVKPLYGQQEGAELGIILRSLADRVTTITPTSSAACA